MNEFKPKPGEIIEVSNTGKNGWQEREFIGMTIYDKYLCWAHDRTTANPWGYARPVDKFRELKECCKLGAKFEYKLYDNNNWKNCKNFKGDWCQPSWNKDRKYRIKNDISTEQFLKHHKEIVAFWNGKAIESLSNDNWYEVGIPVWDINTKYRVKKEPTCFYQWGKLSEYGDCINIPAWDINNESKAKEEPTYYYQWEAVSKYRECIILSQYVTDEYAEEHDYVKDGWRKIESSKRTWDE
jgi:hypothetical protein